VNFQVRYKFPLNLSCNIESNLTTNSSQDIDTGNEHAATHSDSGEEFLSDDITFSLDLSDIDDDSKEGNSEEQGGHANSGVGMNFYLF
jgi:hypothetical protein